MLKYPTIFEKNQSNSANLFQSTVLINPWINEFIDCIENLPSRLQLLLSELRNIDAQVNCINTIFIYLFIWKIIKFNLFL